MTVWIRHTVSAGERQVHGNSCLTTRIAASRQAVCGANFSPAQDCIDPDFQSAGQQCEKICDDRHMPDPSNTPERSLLVVCLCAEWCGVCREYRERFSQVQALFPQARFLWVDVEDDADLLHPLDVEDFPTLLMAVGDRPCFFGTVTPQAKTLERLIRAQLDDALSSTHTDAALAELVAQIRAEKLA